MINSLYIFSTGSYVVADEWNANFKVLAKSNNDCTEAISDAEVSVSFPDGDLSELFAALKRQPNSSEIPGNIVLVAPENEYYKSLGSGEDLTIQIPEGLNSEVRIIIHITDDRALLPFSVAYSGETHISYGEDMVFNAGTYFILIYETNGHAFVKLIWTEA